MSDSEWQERLSQITRVLNRGPWSAFERIYVLVAVIVSFVLPWPIIALVQHLIIGQLSDGVFLTEEDSRKIFDARMASFGILVGIMLLAWVPYIIMSCLVSPPVFLSVHLEGASAEATHLLAAPSRTPIASETSYGTSTPTTRKRATCRP